MKRKKLNLELEIKSVFWARVPGLKRRLDRAAEEIPRHLPESLAFIAQKAELVVLLTTDWRVQALNRDYRGLDRPTNVLSFPSFEGEELEMVGKMEDSPHIGDIALAYRYSAAEARREKKILLDHVTHLVIHGILHLLGYDHESASEADVMERLEIDIMAALGLPNPYAAVGEDE